MIRSFRALTLVLTRALSGAAQGTGPHVVLHTDAGDIERDRVHAPETTANFLRYVNAGF